MTKTPLVLRETNLGQDNQWRSLWRWTARGVCAVIDQALFALSHLLVNVLLARWLAPDEYGAFVTAYTLLLLVSVGHSALLIEPMMVLGPARYAAALPEYLRVILRCHWTFSLWTATIMAAAILVLTAWNLPLLSGAMIGATVASPFFLLCLLMRRACYTLERPGLAALAGVVYMAFTAAGAVALNAWGLLSSFSGQVLLGVSSIAAAMVMFRIVRPSVEWGGIDRAAVWSAHWSFGRWGIASGLLFWAQGYAFYLLLPIWGGLEATATLRALINIVMPLLQSDGALVLMLVPAFVQARASATLTRMVLWCTTLFAFEAIVYWMLVGAFHRPLVSWLYGERYVTYSHLLWLLGALPLVASLYNIFSVALRALEQPDKIFWANVGSTAVTATVGIAAMHVGGISGAIAGLVLASFTQMLLVARFFWTQRHVAPQEAVAKSDLGEVSLG